MTDNILLNALKLGHSNLKYYIYIYTQIIHFDAHAIFMAMHLKSNFPNRLKQITYVGFLKIISTNCNALKIPYNFYNKNYYIYFGYKLSQPGYFSGTDK